MTAPSLNTLLPILLLGSPAFTRPSFRRFLTLFSGWVRTSGLHAVTESLVVAGVSGTLHHAAFHRFFSRARWSLDGVGHLLLLKLVALVPGPLRLVLDDTLCTHKGPKVFGLGVHVDAVRSTRRRRLLTFGHVWVVLAVWCPCPLPGESGRCPSSSASLGVGGSLVSLRRQTPAQNRHRQSGTWRGALARLLLHGLHSHGSSSH
jgi:hypothetical protein